MNSSQQIVGIDKCPKWACFPYILTGYRVGYETYYDCFKSMFSVWHNESFNALSMVVVALMACGLYSFVLRSHALNNMDVLVFTSFLLSCIVHTPFSIAYHTFMCMSEKHKHFYRNLDIIFIFVAASFLTFSLYYYVFPVAVTIAMTCTSFAMAFFMSSFLIKTKFNDSDPSYKRVIVSIIGISVLIYIIPMIYECFRNVRVIPYSVGALSTIGIETLIYVSCIPERYMPVRFDSFGSSHNIMHILLMVAYVFEFLFVYEVSGLRTYILE